MVISNKKLNRLNAFSHCVNPPCSIKGRFGFLQPIKKAYSIANTYAWRTFYLVLHRQWHNNKSAASLVRYYVLKANLQEQTPTKARKIEKIFHKLQPISKNKKIKLQDIDPSWVKDHKTDPLHKFHKVKEMPKISAKMFFHLHGDAFGENNSSLEGHSLKETLAYLNTYLNKRKEQGNPVTGVSDAVLEEIKNAAALAENFQSAHAKITEAFEQNKRLLIPGGWVGCPSGHAMCYEIIPESQESATVRIFNLGAGSSEHFNAIVGNKLKTLPYIEFKGVSKKSLLDKNTLLALNELLTHAFIPQTTDKTEYSEIDIYEGIKALIKPKNVTQGEGSLSADALKTLQRAGICSLRSPMAFLSTCMPKEDYKRLVCDIRLQSLSDWVQQCGQTQLSKAEWHLTKKSQQNLSRKIAKRFEDSLVGKQYAFKSCIKLKKISDWLDKKRDESFSLPAAPIQAEWGWAPLPVKGGLNPTDKPLHLFETAANTQKASQSCAFVYHQVDQLDVQDLKKAIPSLLALSQTAAKANEHQALHTSLVHFFTKLDVDAAIATLTEVDKDKLIADKRKLMADLGKLSQIFFETCLRVPEATAIHSERHYTLLKILFLQKNLSGYPFDFDLGKLKYANFFFKNSNPKIQAELKRFTEGFKEYRAESYSFTGAEEPRKSSSIRFSEDQGSINKRLQELFPEVVEAFKAKDPHFVKLEKQNQNACIYASEELPEWFKGMRNTHFYLLYLSHEPVINPPIAEIDCDLHLKVKHTEFIKGSSATLFFSVKGITPSMWNYDPKVKYTRNKPEYRYENLFRPFKDLQIQKIVEILISSKTSDEKKLLADHISNYATGVSDELYKMLRHIFIKNSLKIAETYSYFAKNPAKLMDPDHQVLLEIAFFDQELLKEEMGIEGFAANLGNFLLKQHQYFSEKNEIQTAVFLLKMLRLCGEYAPTQPQYMGTLQKLRVLLAQNGLSAEEKSVIYAEIVSALSTKETLDELDLENLLIGTCHLRTHPVPAKWMCPETNKNVRNALHVHSKKIQNALNQPNRVTLLSKISKEILGTEIADWQLVL